MPSIIPGKRLKRPESCDEKNCEPLVGQAHKPGDAFSIMCIGIRKGPIKGKKKALKNIPHDVFPQCFIIGTHSEAAGRHCFVANIEDFYTWIRTMFMALDRVKIFDRVMEYVFNTSNFEERLEKLIKYRKRHKHSVVDYGSTLIRYYCSCGQELIRDYKQRGGKYYKLTKDDEILFRLHRRLGHRILWQKAMYVRHSSGKNPYWRDYPVHEWKPRKLSLPASLS